MQYFVFYHRKASEFFDDEQLDLDAPIDKYSLSDELQSLLDARVKALNNLAMCQMKVEAWDSAAESLGRVLKLEVRCH